MGAEQSAVSGQENCRCNCGVDCRKAKRTTLCSLREPLGRRSEIVCGRGSRGNRKGAGAAYQGVPERLQGRPEALAGFSSSSRKRVLRLSSPGIRYRPFVENTHSDHASLPSGHFCCSKCHETGDDIQHMIARTDCCKREYTRLSGIDLIRAQRRGRAGGRNDSAARLRRFVMESGRCR